MVKDLVAVREYRQRLLERLPTLSEEEKEVARGLLSDYEQIVKNLESAERQARLAKIKEKLVKEVERE